MSKKTVSIRIDLDTHCKLKELADRDIRTIGGYIKSHVLSQYAALEATKQIERSRANPWADNADEFNETGQPWEKRNKTAGNPETMAESGDPLDEYIP